MQHTSYYNTCKSNVKNMIGKPKDLKFWTGTQGKRKSLIASIDVAKNKINAYKSGELTQAEKNRTLSDLKYIFKNIMNISKSAKEYIEITLMFMQIEDIIMECNLDPTDITSIIGKEEDEDKGKDSKQ